MNKSYDQLAAEVQQVYDSLGDLPEAEKISSLTLRFRLTRAEVFDLLGIKDQLDFGSASSTKPNKTRH